MIDLGTGVSWSWGEIKASIQLEFGEPGLHQTYLNDLREKKLFITNTFVINYVNGLHPSLLMYCLNHHMRKRVRDTVVADTNIVGDE